MLGSVVIRAHAEDIEQVGGDYPPLHAEPEHPDAEPLKLAPAVPVAGYRLADPESAGEGREVRDGRQLKQLRARQRPDLHWTGSRESHNDASHCSTSLSLYRRNRPTLTAGGPDFRVRHQRAVVTGI